MSYQDWEVVEKGVERCGFCGRMSQKVCWRCFQDTIHELEERIRNLEAQIKK